MRFTLKPYPEYKDSGLPWLGRIPAHWREKRAKYYFREVDERSHTGQEELLSVSHTTGVTPRSHKNITMFMAESYVGHKLCQRGDLVVNTMWAWAGALGIAKQAGIVSPSYAVYRAIGSPAFVPEFLDELVRTGLYVTEYVIHSIGIRKSRLRLYPDKLLTIPLVCSPVEEQREIINFLRVYDRCIARLIRAKRRMILTLGQQKQAIVHRAVTRGLDSEGCLKPSGLAWVGDIPESWQVQRLKTLCNMKSGDGITSLVISRTGEYPVYGANGIRGYTSSYTHDGDYILIGRQGALCGNVHHVRGRFWASEHAVVVTCCQNTI